MDGSPAPLDEIYLQRFPKDSRERRSAIWKVISAYLQRYVPKDARVLDLACGEGNFIRHVAASERWATDARDVGADLPADVTFHVSDGLLVEQVLPTGHFDVVFMSNYLEHLESSQQVIEQLRVCNRLLRGGGAVLILQPNVRLVGRAYWDFIDHKVALTEKSLVEAAGLAGFRTEVLVKRFLPYTTQGRLPNHPALVWLYLKVPPAWRLLGKQTLYLGRKEA